MTTSTLPFSPVPTDPTAMRFEPDDDWTYTGAPMRVLWGQGYRDAAWSLLQGDVERATAEARTARSMELAYSRRMHDEWRARHADVSGSPSAAQEDR